MISPSADLGNGIWEDYGDISWWPVAFFPTRKSVNNKLVEFDNGHSPDEVIIRIAFMREEPRNIEEHRYVQCSRKHRNAIKCWCVETRG